MAHRFTWYGRWGYEHGRGAFNISKATWRATLTNLHNIPMAALMEDFLMHTSDGAITEIIDRYQATIHLSPPLPSPQITGPASYASVQPLTSGRSRLHCFLTFAPSAASSPLPFPPP